MFQVAYTSQKHPQNQAAYAEKPLEECQLLQNHVFSIAG
jgi:hypothetical protein